MQVKPIYLGGVLKELAPFLEDRHLVVSIAAGVQVRTTIPPCTGTAGAGAAACAGGIACESILTQLHYTSKCSASTYL